MYKSLQAGRAIAASLVVLFHLGGAVAADKYFGIAAFSVPFSFGSAGVEFFFVLSGFIILTAHRQDIFKPHRLSSYIKKRLIRIYPTYWIIFLAVFLLAIASPSLRNTVPHDAIILLKSLLLIPQASQVVGGTGAPIINVAWTLHYEMFFYLCFALLILNRWLAIICGLTLLYLYVMYNRTPSAGFPLSFLANDYVLLFVMGMLVSLASTAKNVVANRPWVYASLGAVMFACIALDTVLQINLLSAQKTILYGLACSLIIFGLAKAEDQGRVFGGQRPVQILGDASYALYLIHYPLISILCKLAMLAQLNKLGVFGAIIAYCSILGGCLIASVAFHWWIEKPAIRYFRNRHLKPDLVAEPIGIG